MQRYTLSDKITNGRHQLDTNIISGCSEQQETLFLLTRTYPYDHGEEFIEAEIEYDAKAFTRIIIIATGITRRSKITRKVPSNVLVFGIKEPLRPIIRYMKYALRGLMLLHQDILKNELKSANTIKHSISILYTYGRAIRNTERIDAIQQVVCSSQDKLLFYSYWCIDTALTVVLLKQKTLKQGMSKAVSRAHGYDLYDDRNIVGIIPFRRYVLKGIDYVFPCSDDGKRHLNTQYPGYEEKIKTAYLGTAKYTTDIIKERKNHFHIVTCSSIVALKRIMLVAKAVHECEKKGIILEWTCIGDGPMLEEIKRYTKKSIQHSRVTFLGQLSNHDVIMFYRNTLVDLFINVSMTEGLPVSIMEAISFGIPVLATNVGGTKEIVRSEEIGCLMESDLNANKLSDYIIRMTEKSFSHEKIIDFWTNNFSAKKNYSLFSEQLKELIE